LLAGYKLEHFQWPADPLRPSQNATNFGGRTPASREVALPDLADTRVPGSDPGLRVALEAAGLPTDDLGELGRTFFVYRDADEATIGYGGYEPERVNDFETAAVSI
jgi:hypothetical protein